MPPFAIDNVPVVSDRAIPKEEVAKAWTFPVAPVGFPRIVLAAIVTSLEREIPLVARESVEFLRLMRRVFLWLRIQRRE